MVEYKCYITSTGIAISSQKSMQSLPEQPVWHALTASITLQIMPIPAPLLQMSWPRRRSGSILYFDLCGKGPLLLDHRNK